MQTIKTLIENNKYICNSNNHFFEITNFNQDELSICPQGGGFVKVININNPSFIDKVKNKKLLFLKEMPSQFKKVKLFFDHFDGDFIFGYTTERRWNGWTMPYVELDEIKKFNQIQSKHDCFHDWSTFKIIDEDTISIIDVNERDEIKIKSEQIVFKDQILKVFDVSLGMTWEQEEI